MQNFKNWHSDEFVWLLPDYVNQSKKIVEIAAWWGYDSIILNAIICCWFWISISSELTRRQCAISFFWLSRNLGPVKAYPRPWRTFATSSLMSNNGLVWKNKKKTLYSKEGDSMKKQESFKGNEIIESSNLKEP